ncbi:MAG: large ribosomal subunit protein uL22 [Dialister invisus]
MADLIRGKSAGEALSILRNTPKAASSVVEKALRSGAWQAQQKQQTIRLIASLLHFYDFCRCRSRIMKRAHPRSR